MKWNFVVLSMAFATIHCVVVDPCSESIPTAVNFVSEGCDEFPCPLVKETTTNVNITFRIPYDVETSTIKILANIAGSLWVPFSPKDPNTCNNLLDSFCPLGENEIVTYHLAIPILKFYPDTSMTMKIQFLDEAKKAMMCILVPCKIVAATKNF